MFEVLEEAFLLPLFFGMSKTLNTEGQNKKIFGKIYIIFAVYILFIVLCIILTPQLLEAMSKSTYNVETIKYIRMEFGNRLFSMLIKIISILLIAKAL